MQGPRGELKQFVEELKKFVSSIHTSTYGEELLTQQIPYIAQLL